MNWLVICVICIISSLSGCAYSKHNIRVNATTWAYNKLFDAKHRAFIKAFEEIGIKNFTIAKNIPVGKLQDIDMFCDNNRKVIVSAIGYPEDIRDDLFAYLKEEIKKNYRLLYKLECLK